MAITSTPSFQSNPTWSWKRRSSAAVAPWDRPQNNFAAPIQAE
jgi:hypothetical protein